MPSRIPAIAAALLLGVSMLISANARAAEITVAAAESLHESIDDIAKSFMAETGTLVKTTIAGSSQLAKQIETGAPVNVFISADKKWIDFLAEKKLIAQGSEVIVAGNALVLIMPADTAKTVEIDDKLDLASLLGANGKLATGEVKSVPAGRYAKEALETLKLWTRVEGKIAGTENVRAALALVERGEAPVGIVYATDALLSAKVKVAGVFPETSHTPIVYPAVVITAGDTPEAKAFIAYLKGAAAQAILKKYGFTTP